MCVCVCSSYTRVCLFLLHRYAGGHINGIARIRLGQDAAWTWVNDGLLGADLWQNETIVPAIQVDPANGGRWLLGLEG